jgi:TnpA family transposase
MSHRRPTSRSKGRLSLSNLSSFPGPPQILGRRIKTDVVRKHWNENLRLVASLKAGIVLPSAMLKRLAAYRRQNQLDLALQELGRIKRTLFMLDWLESAQLRQLCHAGLNKSEQRHALAQMI